MESALNKYDLGMNLLYEAATLERSCEAGNIKPIENNILSDNIKCPMCGSVIKKQLVKYPYGTSRGFILECKCGYKNGWNSWNHKKEHKFIWKTL